MREVIIAFGTVVVGGVVGGRMFNVLRNVLILQLEMTLQVLTLTKSALEIGLRLQPQPSRVTSPVVAMLPVLIGRSDVVPPVTPPERH